MRVSYESILAADSLPAKPTPHAERCSGCGTIGRTDRDPVFDRSEDPPPLLTPVSGWGDGSALLCPSCRGKRRPKSRRRVWGRLT
jgi:hypothetical protein